MVKSFNEADLYKKAGFKTAEDFKSHAEWNIEDLNGKSYNITVYGKTSGRANQENKYEFPPPIDNKLFFGNCVVVNRDGVVAKDLPAKEWQSIYNYLYGGFEDMDGSESESEEDLENVVLDKYGYEKNDFIADDDDLEIEDVSDDETEDEDVLIAKKSAKKKKPIKKNCKIYPHPPAAAAAADMQHIHKHLDCSSELSEESYLE